METVELILSFLKMILGLVAVLSLLYVVLRFGKKMNYGGNQYIQMVEKAPLTNQAFLAVIRVGKSYHLASVSSGKVELLKELPSDEVEELLERRRSQLEGNPMLNVWRKRNDRE
jgi:flagellar biogenesis protein FliO